MFQYNMDKHGNLQKYKARLVVYGNQPQNHDLSTQATILAITFLRILLAVATEFDLGTLQLSIVNAFVYTNLDKTVFMKMPLEYLQSR